MHWPFWRKSWMSGSKKFSGRTVGVTALVGVTIETVHLSCVRLKRTWKIMWLRRHSRLRSPRALDQRLRDGTSFSYDFVLPRGNVVHLESLQCSSKRLISREFGRYTTISVGIKQSYWIDGPWGHLTHSQRARLFFIPMGGIEEREWKANFRFGFHRARRNDSQGTEHFHIW